MPGRSPILQWRESWDLFALDEFSELDRAARRGIEAAEADARVASWIEGHAGPLWGALGLHAGRAFRRVPERGAAGGFWEPQGPGTGTWCLMLPWLGCRRPAPEILALAQARGQRLIEERWYVVDILAIDPDGEQHVSTLSGVFDGVLGRWDQALTGLDGEVLPLRVFRSPLAWLRHALQVEAEPGLPEPVCLAWPNSADARHVLLHAGELIADDDAHAAELDRAIRRARKAALPPVPKLKVARAAKQEEIAA